MEDRESAIRLIFSICDLTSLNEDDTEERIRSLCARAAHPVSGRDDMPHVAAVCIYPKFINAAREAIGNAPVKLATVAGGFPSGDLPQEKKLDEVRAAIALGADEVDYVIDYRRAVSKLRSTAEEVSAAKKICGAATLKVILETGALGPAEIIREVSDAAIAGGADFLKTSTGKRVPAATPVAVRTMAQAVQEHFRDTGKIVGIKAAGGIASFGDAMGYIEIVREILGNDWLTPQRFRIGASRLIDDLVLNLRTVGDKS